MDNKKWRLRKIWFSMKDRCFNQKNARYPRYGGRGITVCEDWMSFDVFKAWAIESGYTDDLTIDRIDNDGDYCPENCRWADMRTQCNNRSTNHLLTLDGRTQTMSEWSRELAIPLGVIHQRKRNGWSDERALTEPVNSMKMYELNGEMHSLTEWEGITGIPMKTLHKRVTVQGLSMEEAIQDTNFNRKYISFNGKTQSLAEWAREYGMNSFTLRERLVKTGWDMGEAISTPVREMNYPNTPVVLTYQGRSQSVPAWSRETGISTAALYDRKRKGWDDEKILTTPVRGSKTQAKTA